MNRDMNLDPSSEEPSRSFSRVKVVGVGSGGTRAVGRIRQVWEDGPPCLGIDTDVSVLGSAPIDETIEIGATLARGEGTGGDPKVGVTAAEDEFVRLTGRIGDGDLIFLVSTLGGGTGTGASPVVARAARESGAVVICIVTVPFSFEGDSRRKLARRGIQDLRQYADAVVVLPNDRMMEWTGEDESVEAGFTASDSTLSQAVHSIWWLLTQPGLMHLSLADVRRLLEQSGGTCSLGFGRGSGPDRAHRALDDLLHNPLTERGAHLAKASACLISIVGCEALTLREIQTVMDGIRDVVPRHAYYVVGAGIDPSIQESLSVTVLTAEQWIDGAEPDPEIVPDRQLEKPSGEPSVESSSETRARQRTKPNSKRRELQRKLAEASIKDRFKDVEPTLHHGEDLDSPTFIRKGTKLPGETRG